VLSWRPLLYVGTISYGVYVYHNYLWFIPHEKLNVAVSPGLAGSLNRWFAGEGLGLLVPRVLVTIGLAALSWKFFEKPLNDLKRHFEYDKAKGAQKTDWEVELGVVIGKNAKYVPENHAMDYVAGYCVVNDVSEREFQIERGGQWDKGKGCDTFGPTGPWLVTKDEVPDPQNLAMWLEVDGHRYQNGSTKTMIFNVPKLVSYLSHFMSLQPGDVISTGTPPGVGMGQKPNPIYLKAGQTMRLSIEGLGVQQQKLVQG